ncbi:MAG: response regulator [Candidatus Omnitrophica bacterium]|nr:response regulator [Candidatus Omnitrophota bacterium]
MADGKKILVIDDDQDLRQALRAFLEANGYVICEADSAENGIRVYKAERPDAIVVDLMMEEVDSGVNFVKELRLQGNTAPVFLLSGAGDSVSTGTDYSQLGFSGVFQKPLNHNRLLNVLETKLK